MDSGQVEFQSPSDIISALKNMPDAKVSATLADGTALPSWLTFDPATGTFSGNPKEGASPGNYHIKVTVVDAKGNKVEKTFKIQITETSKKSSENGARPGKPAGKSPRQQGGRPGPRSDATGGEPLKWLQEEITAQADASDDPAIVSREHPQEKTGYSKNNPQREENTRHRGRPSLSEQLHASAWQSAPMGQTDQLLADLKQLFSS